MLWSLAFSGLQTIYQHAGKSATEIRKSDSVGRRFLQKGNGNEPQLLYLNVFSSTTMRSSAQ